jgi:hypothetical protein
VGPAELLPMIACACDVRVLSKLAGSLEARPHFKRSTRSISAIIVVVYGLAPCAISHTSFLFQTLLTQLSPCCGTERRGLRCAPQEHLLRVQPPASNERIPHFNGRPNSALWRRNGHSCLYRRNGSPCKPLPCAGRSQTNRCRLRADTQRKRPSQHLRPSQRLATCFEEDRIP